MICEVARLSVEKESNGYYKEGEDSNQAAHSPHGDVI
jgi:hypothetical protein